MDEFQTIIEKHYRETPTGSYDIKPFGVGVIHLNFARMRQRRQQTGMERDIRRRQDVSGAWCKPGEGHMISVSVDVTNGELKSFVDGLPSARHKIKAMMSTKIASKAPVESGAQAAEPGKKQVETDVKTGEFHLNCSYPLCLFGHSFKERQVGAEIRWVALFPEIRTETAEEVSFLRHCEMTDWQCAKCSTVNRQLSGLCKLCKEVRTESAVKTVASAAPGCVKGGATSSKWKCQVCTETNDFGATCKFCGTSRPGEASENGPWTCGCQQSNPSSASRCSFCGMEKGHNFDW